MDIYETIVNDFIRSAGSEFGYGFFSGIETAKELAKSLCKNEIRRFKRYKYVPQLFFQCLRQAELIDPKIKIPSQGRNLHETEKFLKDAGFWKGLSPEEFKLCELHIQAGTQQHVWHKIINEVRFSKNASIPRSQKIMMQSPPWKQAK